MTISDPTYRPENVTIDEVESTGYGAHRQWLVSDFDGTPLQYCRSFAEAQERAKWRKATIKAALTRRANKARRAKILNGG